MQTCCVLLPITSAQLAGKNTYNPIKFNTSLAFSHFVSYSYANKWGNTTQ